MAKKKSEETVGVRLEWLEKLYKELGEFLGKDEDASEDEEEEEEEADEEADEEEEDTEEESGDDEEEAEEEEEEEEEEEDDGDADEDEEDEEESDDDDDDSADDSDDADEEEESDDGEEEEESDEEETEAVDRKAIAAELVDGQVKAKELDKKGALQTLTDFCLSDKFLKGETPIDAVKYPEYAKIAKLAKKDPIAAHKVYTEMMIDDEGEIQEYDAAYIITRNGKPVPFMNAFPMIGGNSFSKKNMALIKDQLKKGDVPAEDRLSGRLYALTLNPFTARELKVEEEKPAKKAAKQSTKTVVKKKGKK